MNPFRYTDQGHPSSTSPQTAQCAPIINQAPVEQPDLRDGIDPGDPLTKKGRIKKRKLDDNDDGSADPNDPDRYSIINNGIKRRAKLAAGENVAGIQSDYEYDTFLAIVNHLEGFDEDIVRLKHHPKVFRKLVRCIREAADQARNNDTANLKRDISCMLTDEGDSVLKAVRKGVKSSSKNDRGFENPVMGRYLCPVSLDWDDPSVQDDIREGRISITAGDWPRLLYAGLDCDLDDMEIGLGRNIALVRVVKYLFTGRSSAFSDTPGGKTTRAGNAALAGMSEITPKVVAYGACMLRFAISNEESWTKLDKEFNYEDFYWHVVGVFEDSGEFGKELLAWWNLQVFGTSEKTSLAEPTPCAPTCLSVLRTQRAAKRARIDQADKENDPLDFPGASEAYPSHDIRIYSPIRAISSQPQLAEQQVSNAPLSAPSALTSLRHEASQQSNPLQSSSPQSNIPQFNTTLINPLQSSASNSNSSSAYPSNPYSHHSHSTIASVAQSIPLLGTAQPDLHIPHSQATSSSFNHRRPTSLDFFASVAAGVS